MILVTGGTGFAGRHLVRELAARRHDVRVMSRKPAPAGSAATSWVQGDLCDAASLPAVLRGVETVIHAGAVIREGDAPDLARVNVEGTAHLARAARESGVRRFIHVSSAGVYGEASTPVPHAEGDLPRPRTPYERSKLSAERALLDALADSRVRWTVLRPQGLYGADRPATVSFFRDVANRRLWIHGPAPVIVHPTHVSDLVSAILLVLAREDLHGETFNVGGQRALPFRELIKLVGAHMGRAPRQCSTPRLLGRCAAAAGNLWPGPVPTLLERLGRGLVNRAVSIDRARARLGFEPIALELGIGQTAAAVRAASG